MALTRYTCYAVNIDQAAAGTDFLIDQISSCTLNSNMALIVRGSDGSVDPTYAAVMSQAPRANFSTSAVATILGKVGIAGLAVEGDADEDGAALFFQALAEGGTRGGAGTNIKAAIIKGLLLPRSITAGHNTPASYALELVAIYDGTNAPVVISTSQDLTGSPSVDELFVAGPAYVNGTQIEGVQNIAVDFGISEIVRGSDGGVYPTYGAIMSRSPSIRITVDDPDIISTLGLNGVAQGATDSVVYLRKIAEGGTRVADATAQHISFTVDEGHIGWEAIGGGHGDITGMDIVIRPTYDGTNAIIAVSAATAIT